MPQGKPAKLMTYIQDEIGLSFSDNDLESLQSADDEIGPNTICAIEGYTKAKECYKISNVHTMHPSPVISMQIISTKYAKPIKVAVFFDTCASFTMMNPDILPPQFWKKEKKYFHTANGDVFATELIRKTTTLQFFPVCSVAHKVINKVIKKADLRILPTGLRYKQYFTSWEPIQNYFLTPPEPFLEEKTRLCQTSCADSHADFLLKCNHPLWKNEQFFISLPFKMN